ncbi:hypothetical protein BGZ94_010099 [Podila epigama]|nr:hypothetical protein BGZ94_010099 [Podila epigama]
MLHQFNAKDHLHPHRHDSTNSQNQDQQHPEQVQNNDSDMNKHSHMQHGQNEIPIHPPGFVQTWYSGGHQHHAAHHLPPNSLANLEQPSPFTLNYEQNQGSQHPHQHHLTSNNRDEASHVASQQHQHYQEHQQQHEEETSSQNPEIQFHRKRSLSVPLLFATTSATGEAGGAGVAEGAATAVGTNMESQQQQEREQQELRQQNHGEHTNRHRQSEHNQGMDTDMDYTKRQMSPEPITGPILATMIDHTNRDLSLSTLPRTHRHRVLQGLDIDRYNDHNVGIDTDGSTGLVAMTPPQQLIYQHPHNYQLYYNSPIFRHHHQHRGILAQQRSFRYQSRHQHHHSHPHQFSFFNPFSHRKFPAYQHWATSAQRDYHLSTIGMMGTFVRTRVTPSGMNSASDNSYSTNTTTTTTTTTPTDLVLRTAHGSSGINKTQFRSRLPVHLRHITSRTSRRPAVLQNPFLEHQQRSFDNPSRSGTEEGSPSSTFISSRLPRQRDAKFQQSSHILKLFSVKRALEFP